MTWPLSNLVVTDIDANTDAPSVSRPVLFNAADYTNMVRKHITEFAQGVLACTTEQAARGLLKRGSVGFTAMGSAVLPPTGTGRFKTYGLSTFNDNHFRSDIGEYVVPESGAYVVSYAVVLTPPSLTFLSRARLFINGLGVVGSDLNLTSHGTAGTNPIQLDRTTVLYLGKGDVLALELIAYGGGNSISAPYFSAVLVG